MSKYWAFIRITAKQTLNNRANIIGNTFLLLIILFIYNQLWTVIGVESDEDHLSTHFIWYLLMGELIILSTSRLEKQTEDDIKSGTLAYYINKPISFFTMRFAEAAASVSITWICMTTIGCSFIALIVEGIPFKLYHFPIILICIYLSCLISIMLYTAIGFSAIWIKDVRTLSMVLQRTAFIFGGAIFPLTIYPDWFVNIAKWTPFYSIYYLTIKLVYDFSWSNVCFALLINLAWVSFFSIFIFFAYKSLSKRVNVNGG